MKKDHTMKHDTLREGAIAGIIGATSVALWFFIVDLIARSPLLTPRTLGAALMSVFGAASGEGTLEHVALYTLFHYAAFILVGVILFAVIHASDREPSILSGFLILFVAFEVAFYGFTALVSESSLLGTIAWYQIGIANLLAAVMMGVYMLRRHPEVGRRIAMGLEGTSR